jgi:hypothetical protein
MVIKVKPQECKNAAEEINDSLKILRATAANVMEVCSDLKKCDDDSMKTIASKLSKTVESFTLKIRSAEMVQTALYRVEETYTKAEENIQSKEDEMLQSGIIASWRNPNVPVLFIQPICGPSPEYWRRRIEEHEFVSYNSDDVQRLQSWTSVSARLDSIDLPKAELQRSLRIAALKDMFEEF